MWCVFVHLKMAYDCIHINVLWLKLYKIGISILRIVKDMYEQVKSCVRSCNKYSQLFEYAAWLRQGDVISPILFSLYVEDLELFLQNDVIPGHSFDDILLILLLFADDMVILGKSVDVIDTSLELLCNYCNTWSLEVNVQKTKAMPGIFEKEVVYSTMKRLHMMATGWKY